MASNIVTSKSCYRQPLMMAVAATCLEAGYESTNDMVLETLTEMLQSYVGEVARSSQAMCEHSGRTLVTARDVLAALANLGFSCAALVRFIDSSLSSSSSPLGQMGSSTEPYNAPVLQVGKRRLFPNYIPDAFNYPALPDPHTYIRTKTGQNPENDYVILRERSSMQKRNVERALTRFVARTGEGHALLPADVTAFPMISAQPSPAPYIKALLPCDDDLLRMSDSGMSDGDDATKDEYEPMSKNAKLDRDGIDPNAASSASGDHVTGTKSSKDDAMRQHAIRNPFLRPVKIPKLKKKNRS